MKKVWFYEKGIRMCRKRLLNVHGNYAKSPYGLDQRPNMDLRITPTDNRTFYQRYMEIKSGHELLQFLQGCIEHFFNGAEGDYIVLGRYYTDGAKRHLWNCPVLYLNYNINGLNIVKVKSYRHLRGRNKSTSKVYLAIREFPELKDYLM